MKSTILDDYDVEKSSVEWFVQHHMDFENYLIHKFELPHDTWFADCVRGRSRASHVH